MGEMDIIYMANKEVSKVQRSRNTWKRIARRLRAKYRHELAIERAKRHATQQAMIAMIKQLTDAVQGQIEIIDADWEEPGEKLS